MEKIGRNDPCPCGSGKKYKSCCWKKEQSEKVTKSMQSRSIKALQGGIANMISDLGTMNKRIKELKPKEEDSADLPEKVEPPESSESLEP
ncbi:MAG: hypothetical protein K940chlam3_00784 [Chlamydiae bacterium]|nr:hypothetical protein [Chlamydiota bacterium]